MANIKYSNHALEQIAHRGLSQEIVQLVVSNADKEMMQDEEVRIYQKIVTFEGNSNFLVRVFVNIVKLPPEVVTVYRTSKIEKYL